MSRVSLRQEDAVAVVSFSNPPDNYMDAETESELAAVLGVIETDASIRAVVLTGGKPDVFIRHYDVGILLDRSKIMRSKQMTFDPARPVPASLIHKCYDRIEAMAKPFIAAINGTAMGGGFELALACDIRLVKDGPYDLGLPEVNLGILPGAGGTQRLTRLVGEAKAKELMLLGRTMSPREVKEIGLASLCVEGDVLAEALEIAKTLARRSPRAVGHIKDLITGVSYRSGEEGSARERTLFCDLMVDNRAFEEMSDMVEGKRDIRDPELMKNKKKYWSDEND
ncbi:enoyl-CoA hydratase-related protein [uncultured Sneathiella sp.]|uniref:enoyl-CoA hydratase/isomerase family protein n=1 Tax=uncultured Sneathiella sp. TaxID=879315 RepID=UPI0030EC4E00|tara:strand:- start:4676 stop:5521 length:846 start_codon:yes stop_codon:yes gene_type:complete